MSRFLIWTKTFFKHFIPATYTKIDKSEKEVFLSIKQVERNFNKQYESLTKKILSYEELFKNLNEQIFQLKSELQQHHIKQLDSYQTTTKMNMQSFNSLLSKNQQDILERYALIVEIIDNIALKQDGFYSTFPEEHIKNVQHLLAVLINTHEENVSNKIKEINNYQKVNTEILNTLNAKLDSIKVISSNQFSKLTSIIKNEISAQTIFYGTEGERNRYKDSFTMLMSNEIDIESSFLRLTRGMDHKSIATISIILNRLQLILSNENKRENFLTEEEQREVKRISKEIKARIIKLSENLFCYEGYLLPFNYFDMSVFYYKHGLEKIRNIEKLRNKDIIDAGAFIGDSALILSEYTNKNVHSFEAVPENYENVVKTIELNSLKNVTVVNKAVGHVSGKTKLNIGEKVWCSSLKENSDINYIKEIDIDVISLDDYVKANNLNVGIIKVDIEGAEQDLIKGAKETIKNQKPLILISIYHNADDFFNVKPMLEELVPEYKFIVQKPMPNVILLETNLLAIPAELQ